MLYITINLNWCLMKVVNKQTRLESCSRIVNYVMIVLS
jgi:hypothetical protein